MKKLSVTILVITGLMFGLIGCDNDNDRILVSDPAPEPPQGVFSITGDNEVYIYWNGPYIDDIDGYIVYRSLDPVDNYVAIGTVDAQANPNLDLIVYEFIDGTANNGTTYYYAVTTVDNSGQESFLSAENVFDTPRPEGLVTLTDINVNLSTAGFDFSTAAIMPGDSPNADIFVDVFDGVWYINAIDVQTDLQDLGFTDADFTTIGWAPTDGWSLLGFSELIAGHTYVIWTRDDHYAKVRVESVGATAVSLRWAYQTDQGNPELSPGIVERPNPDNKIMSKQSLRSQSQAR